MRCESAVGTGGARGDDVWPPDTMNGCRSTPPTPHTPAPDGRVILLRLLLLGPERGLRLGALHLGLEQLLLLLGELEPQDLDIQKVNLGGGEVKGVWNGVLGNKPGGDIYQKLPLFQHNDDRRSNDGLVNPMFKLEGLGTEWPQRQTPSYLLGPCLLSLEPLVLPPLPLVVNLELLELAVVVVPALKRKEGDKG